MPQRVLLSLSLYGLGGSETQALRTARVLVNAGAEVTTASRYAHPSTPLVRLHKEIPARFITTPFARHGRLNRLSTLWALAVWPLLFRKTKFDALLVWEFGSFANFLHKFLHKDGKRLFWWRGEVPDLNGREASIVRYLQKCDGILVESRRHAAAFEAFNGYLPPVKILPSLFLDYPMEGPLFKEPGEKIRVGYLGRYAVDKGVYSLLDAWKRLNIDDVLLDFYGTGPEQEGIKRKILELGLQESVTLNSGWHGQEQMTKILEGVDMVVHPSHSEGLPQVLLQCLAHGVPFVATAVGGVPDLGDDNPDVIIVPLGEDNLARGIDEMTSKLKRGEISRERLFRFYKGHYDHDTIVQRHLEAILYPERFWAHT